jgi:hypothetical protein
MLAFRTPVAGYGFIDADLIEAIHQKVTALQVGSALEGCPFGWDIENIEVVIHDGNPWIVSAAFDGEKHVADGLIFKLPEDWFDTCLFPMPATMLFGEC